MQLFVVNFPIFVLMYGRIRIFHAETFGMEEYELFLESYFSWGIQRNIFLGLYILYLQKQYMPKLVPPNISSPGGLANFRHGEISQAAIKFVF